MPPEMPIYERIVPEGQLRQGEIISELRHYKLDVNSIESEQPVFDCETHPYAVVMSQDCDLDWDYRARNGLANEGKLLPSVLFCVADAALDARPNVEPGLWKKVTQNKDERYHVLTAVSADTDLLSENVPALALDFKRYFTIATEDVYAQINKNADRHARLASPWREHLSQRFFVFQARIGLPVDHSIET